jgi:hypothetical protein
MKSSLQAVVEHVLSLSHPAISQQRSAQLGLTFDLTSTSPSSIDKVHHSGLPYQIPHDFSSRIISLPLITVFPTDLCFCLNSTLLISMTQTFHNSCFTFNCDFLVSSDSPIHYIYSPCTIARLQFWNQLRYSIPFQFPLCLLVWARNRQGYSALTLRSSPTPNLDCKASPVCPSSTLNMFLALFLSNNSVPVTPSTESPVEYYLPISYPPTFCIPTTLTLDSAGPVVTELYPSLL